MNSRTVTADKRYLLLPLTGVGGWFVAPEKMQYLSIYSDGRKTEAYEIQLSGDPAFWGAVYLDAYKGREITVTLENGDESLLEMVKLSDETAEGAKLYREPGRPLIHFTPARGFMNDPNGLTYYRGTYHFFGQLNPYGLSMGNTHWMHAVSTDLMHWEEKPYALLPDEMGRMYSGGGVVDTENTSGLKCGDDDPIFLFYTAAGCKTRWAQGVPFTICCAYSLDGGNSFVKYSGNPLFPHQSWLNRDPKVLWNPDDREWMLMFYRDGDRYTLFFSKDLLHWEEGETVRGYNSAECPDMFYLNLDGDPEKRKLVLWFCSDNYQVGTMRNRRFCPEAGVVDGPSHQLYSDFPNHARTAGGYASQTFTNLPEGRVVQFGWLMVHPQGESFVSSMTVPNELKLVSTPKGMRLSVLPVKELETMEEKRFAFVNRGLEEFSRIPRDAFGEAFELDLTLTCRPDQVHAISVKNVLIVYDAHLGRLILPSGAYEVSMPEGKFELKVIADRTSLEIYTGDGLFNTAVKSLAPGSPWEAPLKVVYVEPDTGVDCTVRSFKSMWDK